MQGDVELERTCIVTREVRDPADLIRFVRAPDGVATPDLRRKLPGRGAWVTARAGVVGRATAKAFSRAFKAETAVPPDLPGLVERLLRREAAQSLALANKAGCALAGFDKIAAALASGRIVAILHAREAAADGRRKLAALAAASPRFPAILSPFDGAEMDLALGRIHVIHAALTVGAVSEACLARCRFLLAFGEEGGDGVRAGETTGKAGRDAPAGLKAE